MLAISAAVKAFIAQSKLNAFEAAKRTCERAGYSVTKPVNNKKENK